METINGSRLSVSQLATERSARGDVAASIQFPQLDRPTRR